MKATHLIPTKLRHGGLRAWNGFWLRRAIAELKRLPPGTVPSQDLLHRLSRAWANEGWSGGVSYLTAVCERTIETSGPILECGSGLTTIVVSALAGEERQVVSLEHSPEWCERVEGILAQHALSNPVRHRPLRGYDGFDWYDVDPAELPDGCELVICDGPPETTAGGRYGLLPVCRDRLAADFVVLLDDAQREAERAILERWQAEFGAGFRIEASDGEAYAVVRPSAGS